ncbi:Bcr/CflA family multidrug efflux MFS transporter [Silvimonas amylolytica]|uniref:Bcr/CflA family efflux transporter n=1 Tax=Silvimonas amylolytica TaxID=449663 RepID=A0ABQ2PLA8_9NEIS|nr:Bcr/CflA family multidrug efflux MFS transporter [Silvimonas amylolytica]GGP26001.1 Bcr/CflA family drug resistance efflux transporter [Silvimonas amylolytica]
MTSSDAWPKQDQDHGLRILILLSALMSFSSIATDMYLPALPSLVNDLHADIGRVELTISTFLVGFSAGQLLWGPLSDRTGRRLPILIGLMLFVVGSVGCALSADIAQLLMWRVVQALGACAGPVLARAMVRDLYARERSAQMLSILILMMAVAPLAGPLLGGQILKVASWRAIFGVLAACGVSGLLALRMLPETLPPQQRSRSPLRRTFAEYLQLIKDPRLLTYALAGGFYYGGCYAFIAGTPFAYVDYYHVSPTAFGLLFSVNIVGLMVMNFLNTRLIPRLGSERLFRMGAVIVAVAGLALMINARTGFGGVAGLAIPVFFFMAPSGFIVANSVASALAFFPRQAGAASSLVGAMHYGSGVLTAAMLGWLADGTPWPMGLIVGLCGLGCLTVALLPRVHPALAGQPARG